MTLRRTLEENVFGPFDINEVLDNVSHRPNTSVDLHGLEVVADGRESGLDESEKSVREYPRKTRYFGTLHIDDLNWISPNGKRLVQEDMQRRGLEPSLESIYGPGRPQGGLTVRVGVTFTSVPEKPGSKYIGLSYLVDKKQPDGMFVFTLTTGMKTRKLRIVSLSPMCFIKSQKYIAVYRFCRLLSDVCPKISKPTPEDFFEAFAKRQAETRMPVSKDAIVKLMLRHATWLGSSENDEELDVEMEILENLSLVHPGPDPLQITPHSPARKRRRSVDSRSSLEYASDDQPPGHGSGRESSPERSPSPQPTNPYIAARVPMAFRFAPRVPDDFHWWCDVEGCHYNIDLLNSTRENLAALDGETVAKLRLQDWSLCDPWVRLAFKTMVEDHRVKHLESWGLRCFNGPSGALSHIELTEPPGPDREKDQFSYLKIEFVNLL